MTGKVPASSRLKVLVGHLLLSEPDVTRRAGLAKELVQRAATLSESLRALTWFGTFAERDRRDPDAEMIDEQTTRALVDDLRRRVLAAEPAELASERMVLDLLAMVVEPDPNAGVALVSRMAQRDDLLLALLRAAFGERTSQTLGEAALRSVRRLNWRALSTLLSEDELRRRVGHLDADIDRETLDADTAAALDLAAGIVRGEIDPHDHGW